MQLYPIPTDLAKTAHITAESYPLLYDHSVRDPEGFWGDIAQQFLWHAPWKRVKNTRFTGDVRIAWFEDAKLNITENCIDRHALSTPEKVAILWEGDAPDQMRRITYKELLSEVSKLSNALRALGVNKGDRVTIYMPMVPEAAFAMLACARIGAIHSVVFGGFSPDSIRSRIEDCQSDFIITANEGWRSGKRIALKTNVDAAVMGLNIRHVLVYRHTDAQVPMQAGRDVWWGDIVPQQKNECAAEVMDAEDPLFILYTSGSTGTPKGMLHTTAGYMVYAAITTKYVFDLQPDDIYWCTADVGWITGHSYIVYGPLANGATMLMFEGVPTYPDASRYWQVVDKYRVTKFYSSPTAIRALMRLGDAPVKATSRKSLKILGSVGEPINPEAWRWFHDVVGEGRCPIVDTWWQTETGGHMMTPLPGAMALKPGSCAMPFFGIKPELYDAHGTLLQGEADGMLCIADAWPGMARSIWGNHERFIKGYFSTVPGKYFTSDGCKRDADGYYWITGRVDDVINVSGHRLATAEIESSLVAHPQVAEAAVVGYPHDIKGQGIYAYVTLNAGVEETEALAAELKMHVRKHIGALAAPDFVHLTPGLPKTRSGKIMRRILRKIAENELENLGDTSTLLDPAVVEALIATRKNKPQPA
ncbi:MAG: acetate--CoA ligase [Rhodospirillales bacterium 12-54-5]|nr:MAG: acetate--CoA ligase [Rhodospirillales bacterium 12-54-5]